MSRKNKAIDEYWSKTRSAFLWMKALNTPFWAIFNMLPFILYKDLHANPWQVTAIIILKPATSLISLYWSALINKRRDRLVSNMIWARVLSHLPFFLFPFIENVWFFVLSFGFYMMLARGVVPAWMEVLKLNIPDGSRERIFAYGNALGYIGNALLPFVLGWLLDGYYQAWRWIFPATALLSLLAIFFKYRIPIKPDMDVLSVQPEPAGTTLSSQLIKPWKDVWDLLKARPDFARYQIGFMLGGAGLIIMQPALPHFFVDVLNLSYMELAVALTLFKGIGFAIASPFWAQLLNRIDIYRFNSWVTILAFLFPLFLISAQYHLVALYLGYLVYGVMQGGSEMSWNLSGPIFAKDHDSSVYSSVNVLTVGLRGCFVPALGSALMFCTSSTVVMLFGALLSLWAAERMASYSRREIGAKVS